MVKWDAARFDPRPVPGRPDTVFPAWCPYRLKKPRFMRAFWACPNMFGILHNTIIAARCIREISIVHGKLIFYALPAGDNAVIITPVIYAILRRGQVCGQDIPPGISGGCN